MNRLIISKMDRRITWILAAVLLGQHALFYWDKSLFREDHLIENLQALLLVSTAVWIIVKEKISFIRFIGGMGFIFLFLEEISYGQRIFHYTPPAFFLTYNDQQECNLHNLIFNKMGVFGSILSVMGGSVPFIFFILWIFNRNFRYYTYAYLNPYRLFLFVILFIMLGYSSWIELRMLKNYAEIYELLFYLYCFLIVLFKSEENA
jgi:hypothetical protein